VRSLMRGASLGVNVMVFSFLNLWPEIFAAGQQNYVPLPSWMKSVEKFFDCVCKTSVTAAT